MNERDADEMSERIEVIAAKTEIDGELRELRTELAAAKVRAFTTGEYMEPTEFRQKQARVDALAKESQALQAMLSEIRERERQANIAAEAARDIERRAAKVSDDRAFVNAAHRILDRETTRRIWDVAKGSRK